MAYTFVMLEEVTHLRKPVLAAGIVWGLIGLIYAANGIDHAAGQAIRLNILEYAELFLFLFVALTYINAMDERLVFEVLLVKLVNVCWVGVYKRRSRGPAWHGWVAVGEAGRVGREPLPCSDLLFRVVPLVLKTSVLPSLVCRILLALLAS